MQKTLAMIKPDAAAVPGAAQAIISKMEAAGFTITRKRQYTLYPAQAEEFYAEHAGKPFFSKLIDFMTSGPIWALELQGAGAIKGWRTLMGPTNTLTAQLEAPESIRAQFGTDGTRNATHGSDSPTSAEREISFHFPPQQRTLAMIKPDAVAAGAAQSIKAQIQAQGNRIVQQREYHMSREQAESFYKEHEGKAFYSRLVEFMTSGPIWALELEGLGAIAGWRAMMGPTDSSKAKASAPTTLRATFGTDGTKNAVHGSDSSTSAEREIAFHFSAGTAGAGSMPAAAAAPHSTQDGNESKPAEQVETVVVRPDDSPAPKAEEEAAAVAVQSAVRGHQARQQVEQLKENSATDLGASEDPSASESQPTPEPAVADAVTADSELPAADAEPATTDAEPATKEADVSVAEAEPTVTEAEAEPAVTDAEPAATEAAPAATAVEPAITDAEPSAAEAELPATDADLAPVDGNEVADNSGETAEASTADAPVEAEQAATEEAATAEATAASEAPEVDAVAAEAE